MKHLMLTIAISLVLALGTAFGQSPEAFNYQGIARDAGGNALDGQAIGLRISILAGSSSGTVMYEETHSVTTNSFGLFNIKIGEGTTTSGTFSAIDWKGNLNFVKVEIDPNGGTSYQLAGTNQLVSVPYAMHAMTAADVDDADPDPANEIQTLSKSGSTISLSSSGGSVTDDVDDADANPTNELQTLSLSGSNATLSLGGGTISIEDADANPTNEIQTLSVSGSNLSISGGNTVGIPGDADWTVSGTDIYNNATGVQVGIGTSSPAYPLHVVPNGETYAIYVNDDITTSGTKYGIYVDLDDTYTGSATVYGGYYNAYKSGGGGSTYGLYGAGRNYNTAGSGNTYGVYAYTFRSSSSPASTTYALYATASGSATTEWAGYFSGNVYTTGTYQASDRKLKSNIQPYSGALTTLLQLGTYSYEYNQSQYRTLHLPDGPQIGVIAQDVERLYPSLVRKTVQPAQIMPVEDAENLGIGNYTVDKHGMATVGQDVEFTAVNYSGFVPVLIESIKEQQATIDALNQKVDDLEARLRALEMR